MRKQLLLSTATVGLMLASGLAFAQAPGGRDEPKRVEEGAKGAVQHGQEKAKGATEKAQGAVQEKTQGHQEQGSRQAGQESSKPSTAAEHNQGGAKNEAHERGAQDKEGGRNSAESKSDRTNSQKSASETEHSKTGEKTGEKAAEKAAEKTGEKTGERSGTAATKTEHNQPSHNAAERQNAEPNKSSTANETNRPASTNNAQTTPSTPANQNQANQNNRTQPNQTTQTTTQTDRTQVSQHGNLSPDRRARISETFSRDRIEPQRNLNITVRVGEEIPSHVRLQRLPPDIISIEPEYRDYEYFATDEDVVIVDPRSHRIVSEVPRDPSRARAEMTGGGMSGRTSTGAMSTGGAMAASNSGGSPVQCRVMRRDASGNVAEVSPTTVGSTAGQDSMSVTVQMPGGGSSQPIALGAPAGDIVVATQGPGDCTVTLEPQTR